MKIDLVVTRHHGLVEYLRRQGIIDEDVPIVDHADVDMLAGKHVCGVLPLHLAAVCEAVLVIPLDDLPREMRGKELTADEVAQYAGPPTWYRVEVARSLRCELIADRIEERCGVSLPRDLLTIDKWLRLHALVERMTTLNETNQDATLPWRQAYDELQQLGKEVGRGDLADAVICGLRVDG
ncbi:MAG: hypothetical protein D6812_02800 [Deltaproteobacteria bacterium]|nr:MAG: hypothetical protein D6812_02800 [Deltaproteobacteria bacterium]